MQGLTGHLVDIGTYFKEKNLLSRAQVKDETREFDDQCKLSTIGNQDEYGDLNGSVGN